MAAAAPVFPGQNGRIAVADEFYPPCGDCGPGSGIWVVGHGDVLATGAGGLNPVFSPSGSRMAYEVYNGIFLRRQDGSRPIFRESVESPAWSPAGSELAYRGLRSGTVGVMAADGQKRRRLDGTRAPFAWAPRGGEVAWVDAARHSIRTIRSNGRGAKHLLDLDPAAAGPADLAWMRSGWLAYRRRGAPSSPRDDQLFVNRPGAGERLLVPRMDAGASDYRETHTWSPDGSRVAFLRDRALWVATVPGGRERLLLPAGTAGSLPQWSPDGRLIAYVRGRLVMTVPAAGGRPQLFARFPGSGVAVGLDWQSRPVRRPAR